ncbi:2OG-Fe(II) oxygenase [Fibrella arboris]|uniref:2OG-Fe(II) oxygenase n=1 Tax=Fibrella arboris TaxID=3242486 RepID=UPI0035230371
MHLPINWSAQLTELAEKGFTLLPTMLLPDACRSLADLYNVPGLYRNTIRMQRHGYGSGEYKYFTYPLPQVIDSLRHELYTKLAPVANGWNQRLGVEHRYPTELDAWLSICHAAGQLRPTPLILQYGKGDWNALHQDLYGALHFPFQAVLFLSEPGVDYTGGEFVMLEQRPRMQSKATVLQPNQGQVLLFTTQSRPAKGTRGYYRVTMRHGVSEVTSGSRTNVGLLFHDAA